MRQRKSSACLRPFATVCDCLRQSATVGDRRRPSATVGDRRRHTPGGDRCCGPLARLAMIALAHYAAAKEFRMFATVCDRLRLFATVFDRLRQSATVGDRRRQSATHTRWRTLLRTTGDDRACSLCGSERVQHVCDRLRPFATVCDSRRQSATVGDRRRQSATVGDTHPVATVVADHWRDWR